MNKQVIKTDEVMMKEVLRLAKKGLSWTTPNPMVGAMVVKNGKVIAKGYHKKVGLPHAEAEAFNSAIEDVRGGTLYVNLEPCSHYGRTPPCVDAVISAGIKRVVCASLDPNPKVCGNGIAKLQQAGIDVSFGVLGKEAQKLNETFITFHEKKRPFIAIKFAASLDGKIATRTGDSKWITSEKARQYARTLRYNYQAIVVGVNTVIKDDPHLGARVRGKKDPLRIILDSTLAIPLASQALRDGNVLIATTTRANEDKKQILLQRNTQLLVFEDEKVPLHQLIAEMTKREIISMFIEGGSTVLGSFVDEGLVDKAYAFHEPILVGGRKAISAIEGKGANSIKNSIHLTNVSYEHFQNTLLTVGYV